MLTSDIGELLCGLLLRDARSAHLYANDVTHSAPLRLADYVEPVGAGYRPIRLDPNAWEQAGDRWAYPPLEWEFTGPLGLVYGWFIRLGESRVLAADAFPDAPEAVRVRGDKVRIPLVLDFKIKV